ncbi:uncharacterized protein [Asterias amurensis]|uniref:uncharacterized protein isoform X2 n=1 Tax=Asterias amurensis TaxID=7602 RepID=UPI003AB2DA53
MSDNSNGDRSDIKLTESNNNSLEAGADNNNGCIVSWGCGEFGQHGQGNTNNINAEASFMSDFYEKIKSRGKSGEISSGQAVKGLKAFACGSSHSVVVTDTDEIYTWGNGNSGQLGCGNKDTHLTPQKVQLPSEGKVSPIKGVACGSRHTTLWLENGVCFSWGNNFYAQLGYDFRIENYKDNQVLPHKLSPIAHQKVKQIACGEKHTLFLYETGIVAACGSNSFGQLGCGDLEERVSPKSLESLEGVVYIACGANHSLVVTDTGELFAWGLGRACGYRRQDVLQPVRMMTRQSNVVMASGGCAHSVALTANGTVYTWGGGTEGQLGHGSRVLYLRDPNPLSHDALPKVSQVACGDSYTAAVTGDGILYMWGKSSHVIPIPTMAKQTTPRRVAPAGYSVAKVACGSWHTMASIGRPERQPLEEESGDEQDDDSDSLEDMEAASKNVDIQQPQESNPDDTLLASQQPMFERKHKKTKSRDYIRREGTRLTLAEFYAPTPLPSVLPMEAEGSDLDMDSDPEELEKDNKDQAVVNPEGTLTTGVVFQREDSEVEGETEMISTQESTSFFVDMSVAPSSVPTQAIGNAFETAKPERARRKDVKDDRPLKTSQRQTRRPETLITRSKTMPVANRKPLKMASTSNATAFDWSNPSQQSTDSAQKKDRFVIHKHVSVQMNRKVNSGSGDNVRGMKPIAQIGLLGSTNVKLAATRDKNVMPQPPKFNRAKTYYGRTNQRKRVEAEPQKTKLLSTLPAAAPPPQPHLIPNSKVHPGGHAVLGRLPGAAADSSPVRSRANHDLKPIISEGSDRLGLSGQPLFSSASSWRMRSKDEDVL